MDKVKIQINREHIETGIRKNCFGCPIALAFKDAGMEARVQNETLETGDGVYELPDIAQDFIWKFDRNMPVSPFEFDFDPNDHY